MARKSNRSKNRGSHTHSSGSKKNRRNAGSKGGRGRAGTGKKGDSKKPSHWQSEQFGKSGFTPIRRNRKTCINVSDLHRFDSAEIDLSEHGIDKLLGAGPVYDEYSVVVGEATDKAQEKIEAAQGDLTVEE